MLCAKHSYGSFLPAVWSHNYNIQEFREVWVITSMPLRNGKKGSSELTNCRMNWQFGPHDLKKAQTCLCLVGPQLNSPQTWYPGPSFDYFGLLSTLQLILKQLFLKLLWEHLPYYQCYHTMLMMDMSFTATFTPTCLSLLSGISI